MELENLDLKGKKALVRVDFNVPLDKKTFQVTDDTRIQAAIPTIKKILSSGGSAILMSHFGRPKNASDPEERNKYSLKHILPALKSATGSEIIFAEDCIGEKTAELAKNLKPGEILLLENTRFHPEEEAGDEVFAKKLSDLGDVYINDAFGSAHRAHASTTTVAKFFEKNKKAFGYLMLAEVKNADKVLNNPARPYTAIVGGAKVSDKILLLEKLLENVDNLIIGGGMAYTFMKAKGGNIGKSLVEEERIETAKEVLKKAKEKGVRILLPIDSVVADGFSNDANFHLAPSKNIPDGWMGLDIGPDAALTFAKVIYKSKTILWNGPMGVFEMDNFANGTRFVAQAVANSTMKGAFSLVGGGDSVAAVNQMGISEEVSFVSTGGGAMLEMLEGKTLPGIAAITN
jgi:phosphoglycerate kinase